MPTVLVTGANRGLGLEFVRQYAADGWTVHAACRNPNHAVELRDVARRHAAVRPQSLEVTDAESVRGLAQVLRGRPIDVLINNAGVFGPKRSEEHDPGQVFGSIDFDAWLEVLRVNTLAPLRVAQAFIDHVAASTQRKIVTISSNMGSIAGTPGGYYAYRSSKAAVNMAMACLARDIAARGVAVGLFCPGWVRTDMGGPQAELYPRTSVAALRQRIAELDLAGSGSLLSYDGSEIAW